MPSLKLIPFFSPLFQSILEPAEPKCCWEAVSWEGVIASWITRKLVPVRFTSQLLKFSKMLLKNIWVLQTQKEKCVRSFQQSCWQLHPGNSSILGFLQCLLLYPVWRSCYILNLQEAAKFMCSFIYFSSMHWAGGSQQLLHQDSEREGTTANQGLQISPLFGWKCSRISRWTSQRQRHL